jgi:hypothetical protein
MSACISYDNFGFYIPDIHEMSFPKPITVYEPGLVNLPIVDQQVYTVDTESWYSFEDDQNTIYAVPAEPPPSSPSKRLGGNNPYGSRGCASCITCRKRKGKVSFYFISIPNASARMRQNTTNAISVSNIITRAAPKSPNLNTRV